jgi:hypothetical protein
MQPIRAVERPSQRATSDSRLHVNVVFTTARGTRAALMRAEAMVRELHATLSLWIPQVVPYQLAITEPPVALAHTERMARSLVPNSTLDECDVNVQICLCRNPGECLASSLSPRSLVFVGGRGAWWAVRERKLARSLSALGHEVIFVKQ